MVPQARPRDKPAAVRNAIAARTFASGMRTNTIDPELDGLMDLGRLLGAAGYEFVTPTPATHARVLARPGHEWAQDLRDVFGWSRPFRDGVVAEPILAAMRRAGVLARDGEGWRSLVRLSCLDGMLFFHSAYPTVQADAVFFGPDTYRFAHAIAGVVDRPVGRAVDIGCGAGPGAVIVAREHPLASVFAVDINPRALHFTRANAMLAGVRVEAVESDLLAALPGTFDLIVANPPYMVDPSARAYRHGGGALGAELSLAILETSIGRLAPGGTLLLYTGSAIVNGVDHFRREAATRLEGQPVSWSYREADPDVFGEELEGVYAQADRIAAVVLTVRK